MASNLATKLQCILTTCDLLSARSHVKMTISTNFMKTFSFLLILYCILQETKCDICIKSSSCSCYGPGYEVSLSALDTEPQPRFDHVSSPLTPDVTYSYNPCSSFTKGNGSKLGTCSQNDGVAVCLSNGTDYLSLGTHNSAVFSHNPTTGLQEIQYKDETTNRWTILSLKCTESDRKLSSLTLDNIVTAPGDQINYYMTLSSLCACPNGCKDIEDEDSVLSFGSLLVILFFTAVFVYFFCGILFLYYVQGAQGWEIVPHYEFWLDFPFLVRDGILFVMNGCKSEAIYSRI